MYSSIRRTPEELDENAALGLLQHLDKNELQQLLDDDSKLMELINDVQQVASREAMNIVFKGPTIN